jgi:excisionase family DNA binding protein|tara:strand:- start:1878 stop:2126 length:249 start_codon:yes stop_codon:yes gene_type:complete
MEQLVPIEEVAKHFGISLSTARKWVRDGVIPSNTYVKVGKTQRFALAETSKAVLARTGTEDVVSAEDSDEFDPTAFDPDADL